MNVLAIMIIALIGSKSLYTSASLKSTFHGNTKHEHLHEGLPDKSWFIDQIFNLFSNQTSNFISQKDFKDIIHKLNIEYHDHDDHGHEEHDHNDHDHFNSLSKTNSDNFSLCYTSDQILNIYHLHNPNSQISKNLFVEMSTSLIWLGLNPECHTHEHDHGESIFCATSTLDKYLYGTLSVVLIWAISMICVSLLGKFKEKMKMLTLALKGLAIGTLLSDALLHIIPTALGVHSHDHSGDDHSHDHSQQTERDHRDPMWKMTVTMTTIFGLWLLETFFHHHHKHETDVKVNGDAQNASFKDTLTKVEIIENNNFVKIKTNQTRPNDLKSYLKSVHATGWIAFFGDLMHKVADGFAIAAAFSESLSLGFSTGLAILFHEIPHELGDYAVLTSSGFRHCTVLILNSITSGVGLLAYFILVSLSPSAVFREWIFAITTGVFLYISLVNMIPRVMREFESKDGKPNLKKIFLVMGLFLTGWLIMFLIALFEEQIQSIFSISC